MVALYEEQIDTNSSVNDTCSFFVWIFLLNKTIKMQFIQ